MMFKFYQPQKEQKVSKITVSTKMGSIFLDDEYDLLAELAREEAAELMLDIAKALGYNKLTFGTHPDPALLLAQRIVAISAETGLKPRMVGRIIQSLRWEAEEAKEHQAAAPQENPTDDAAAQLLRIARELGPHDNAALVTIASRILSKEIY
jgi:hypothetical protein